MKPRTAAGGSTGFSGGLFVVWLLGHFGVDLGAEEGAFIASAALSVGAAVAHYGIRGIARMLWRGTGVLLVLAVMAVVAGCGSPRTVTKVVRANPCASQAQMAACVVDMAVSFASRSGRKTAGIRARCTQHGAVWTCLMVLPNWPYCADVRLYKTPRLGLPDLDVILIAPRARCAEAFPPA